MLTSIKHVELPSVSPEQLHAPFSNEPVHHYKGCGPIQLGLGLG